MFAINEKYWRTELDQSELSLKQLQYDNLLQNNTFQSSQETDKKKL